MFYLAVFLSLSLRLAFCLPVPGELKVPRVYNALITSGENLTPSRAIPVFQPILHETAYGYPLHQTLLYDNYKTPNQVVPGEFTSFAAESRLTENLEIADDKAKAELTTKSPDNKSTKNSQPFNKPTSNNGNPESPLKLNDFGLPPSLIPIQQYPQGNPFPYETYNPYNQFYPSVYNHVPYSYNPYLIQTPYYNTPPLLPRPTFFPQPDNPFLGRSPVPFGPSMPTGPPLPTGPPIPSGPTGPIGPTGQPLPPTPSLAFGPSSPSFPPLFTSAPRGPEQQPKTETPSIPDSPTDLDIKNNSNKNPEIPDVPPPPLPKGGLKYEKPATS